MGSASGNRKFLTMTTVSELSRRLASQSLAVCSMLLPGGKAHSGLWLVGDLDGNPGESLKVHLTGDHAGQWRDWATAEYGDLVDLWRLTKNLTPGETVRQVKTYLGISDPPVSRGEAQAWETPKARRSCPPAPKSRSEAFLTQKRGISREIIDRLRIEADSEARAIIFQSFSPSGELLNRSYRTLDDKKRVWQEKGCAPSLFGWQAIGEDSYRSRTILLCEGQLDCATWHQWRIPALSIPNGTGGTWIDFEWDNLEAFDQIYLAFDQDSEGRKIEEKTIARLGRHRCLTVAMPKKDANDCLLAGYRAEDARKWIEDAKPPKIRDLVTAAEMEDRLVAEIRPKEKPFTMPFLDVDWRDEKGFWFRPGELTIWAGFSHAGKSTMTTYFVSQLLCARIGTFIGSFEIRVETQLRKLFSTFVGKHIDEPSAREFVRNVSTSIVYADVVGSISRDSLMEMLWFSQRRYGTQHFFIDSLMRVQDLEEDYPAQGEFCNRLQDFAKDTGSHVHLVAHLGKPNANQSRPTMHNVKGSSLLVNNADNVLLVMRNPEKERAKASGKHGPEVDEMHDTEIIVEKQRETGWTGCFKLNFDPKKLRYSKHETKTP